MIELAVAVGAIASPVFVALRRLKPCRVRSMMRMQECRAHHRPVAVEVPVVTLDGTETGRTVLVYDADPAHVWTNDERLARYEPEVVC